MFAHDHRCVRAIISLVNAMKENIIYYVYIVVVTVRSQRQPTVRAR